MKPLTVYKASAGSGKTFTIATEYIKLLVSNPFCYRNILAVTFTNKATEEMKMRILSQLYGIWKQLPDSTAYLYKVKEGLELSDKQISINAGTALHNLIHNYNYFRVETIDTFFQSVLRNLARELDLTANLRIGLNDKQVEQQAVDELIESLDVNNKMLSWIMQYIKENIEDDKSWNVIDNIKRFGENIYKDFYKRNSKLLNEKLEEKDFFKLFTGKMRAIKKDIKEKFDNTADTFFDLLESNGLEITDFANGKSGVAGYFIKIRKGIYEEDELLKVRVINAMNDPEKWVKKADAKVGKPAFDLVNECLFDLLRQFENIRPKLSFMYKSADITMKNMNQLRLLGSIEKKVRELNEESNRFLLSDTQSLLGSLIQDSDSPFIFEKIGTQLDHIMIDEFQDTSTIQWKNFKVLLEETMSHSSEETSVKINNLEITSNKLINNMLVGDVKQSIYRWRSGDWRLLNSIENEFNKPQIEIESLDTNHRSNRNIIEFNNIFFRHAADFEYADQNETFPEEAEQLKNAYKDVEQKVPDNKGEEGEVSIKLLPGKDYREEMMQETVDTIDYLKNNGIQEKKMAIIVRENQTIQDIADYFMKNRPDIRLVSDEAFRLDASTAVNILINALHVLTHADDKLALANLVKAYQQNIVNDSFTDSTIFKDPDKLQSLLPHEYNDNKNELLTMPIYDLVETLYRIFSLEKLSEQSAYVCAFFDQLGSYLEDNPADIDTFLNEWDENIHSKPIQSDEIDGIRLITIHKSKGLEFDNVIMPFCDWKLEKGHTIWCSPQIEPYNELPLIPVEFSKNNLKGSIYEQDYKHEHLQNVVDNMNLLYVAFTRAGKNLYVLGKQSDTTTISNIIESIIGDVATDLNAEMTESSDKEDITDFSFGSLSIPTDNTEKKKLSDNVFLVQALPKEVNIHSYDCNVEFRQSNKSRDFINNDEDDEKASKKDYISIGNVLHNLFSTIHTVDDLEPALQQLEQDGVIYDEEITRDKLSEMLRKRFENEQVKNWFSGRWTLFNECTILSYNKETDEVEEHRPDRVMTDGKETIVVDFKFGRQRAEYHEQVMEYMSILKEMGHKNIKGYLWFVYNNKIEEVK